jgi:hypothetical protein
MPDTGAPAGLDSVRANALVDHYHKTMELVMHHWERRSRQFVTLVAVLAGAALVAFMRPVIAPALASLFLGHFPKLDPALVDRLAPVAADLLLAFLVILVFYLTASLLGRTNVIISYYGYLEELEAEIRPALAIAPGSVAFTREGLFYQVAAADISRLIGRCYKWVLGLLLAFFFAARLVFDYPSDVSGLPPLERAALLSFVAKTFLFVIDALVFVFTTWLYVRFVLLEPLSKEERRRRVEALLRTGAG